MAKTLVEVNNEVQEIKNNMTKISVLVDRLDITIDKLTEVSTNVSQLLAIQGSRLEFQEKNHAALQVELEKRYNDTHSKISNLYDDMADLEKEHDSKMEKINKDVVEKIDKVEENLKTAIENNHENQSERISRIERWMWILIGGLTVTTFILNQINWAAIF